MAVLAYARTSTTKQDLDSQLLKLEEYGYDKLFTDQKSGRDTSRPGLKAMLDYAREGDVIVVYSLSRLSRSTRDAIDIAERLEEMGVELVSLTEGIDTSTPAGRMYYTILAAFAQMQREQLSAATKAGLEVSPNRPGRRRLDPGKLEQAAMYRTKTDLTMKDIQKLTGVSPSSLRRYMKEKEAGNDQAE